MSNKLRVVDKMMGIKASCQNQLLHATLLVMLLSINKGDAFDCTARPYKTAFILLVTTHTFALVPFSFTAHRFYTEKMSLNLERSLEFISLMLYMMTIFYV